jgi:hypothetical protein
MYRIAFIVMPVFAAAGQVADYLVFAGTYTKATGHGIYAFQFNPSKGMLTALGVATEKLDIFLSLFVPFFFAFSARTVPVMPRLAISVTGWRETNACLHLFEQ